MDLSVDECGGKLRSDEDKEDGEPEYNFPFKPYKIQLELMRVAYESYEKRKFSILESPTGTGKSLSLICSSLTWLKDHQETVKKDLEDEKTGTQKRIDQLKRDEEESGDWLTSQAMQKDLVRQIETVQSKIDAISSIEQRDDARRHAKLHNIPLENYAAFLKEHVKQVGSKLSNNLLDEWKNQSLLGSQESNQTHDPDDEDIEKKFEIPEQYHVRPKIYFASRTHSQLSQFINEIKRTKFADINKGPVIKVAPLASRANLCVNADVLRLKEPNAINERCMELQKEKTKEKRCPYMRVSQVEMLKEDILSSVQDIEDIAARGKAIGSCAYYAARMAVPEAELVVLPYNNLLHHETRKASSMDLKDSIVIVDEAHNILETICSIHSASINGQQLLASHTILSRYYKKYRSKMTPKNAAIILNIVRCLTAMIRFLNEPSQHLSEYENPKLVNLDSSINEKHVTTSSNDNSTKAPKSNQELLIDVNKFIGAAKIEQFNVFKLIDYFYRSQLARKLLGFYRQDNSLDLSVELFGLASEKVEEEVTQKKNGDTYPGKKKRKTLSGQQQVIHDLKQQPPKVMDVSELTCLKFLKETNENLNNHDLAITSYPIYTLIEFLRSLTNLTHDGKVLTNTIKGDIQQSSLKFVLLNPSSQFKQTALEARSIILAGGTMQPFSEFVDLLFEPLGVNRDRLTLFSCGHVVGPEQIHVSALSQGPTGKPLELSFKTRSSFELIDEIGRAIQDIALVTPGGMVCFLPSYEYEQFCFKRWVQIGVIRTIETKCKRVFREPRQTNQLKTVLEEYSKTIEKNRSKNRGALLFCVVGGKMSEGINFNDDLGRCIVMIGLPYANIKSAELQQKISYYDRTCKQITDTCGNQISAGKQYYENLCLKGVNQSIGRSIRHRDDYAAIILLDRRYSVKATIKMGLPAWIRQSLRDHEHFGPMISQLRGFFAKRYALKTCDK